MKIIHSSDWHIGKIVHGIHMTEDQAYILEQFVGYLEKEKPDVVIIAGDIYDRSVPLTDAVELYSKTLCKIVGELNIPVLAIAGNHDNPERVGFASELLKYSGYHVVGPYGSETQKVTLQDEYGAVNFYLVPYEDPMVIRHTLGKAEIKSHQDALEATIQNIKSKWDSEERNVLIYHGFIGGVENIEVSESERPLSIGGSEIIDYRLIEDFDYVALGHLHRPQKIGKDTIRYAGSLMNYHFSEIDSKKSMTKVVMKEKGKVEFELFQLPTRRKFTLIEGDIATLTSPEFYKQYNREDYFMAIITDDGPVLDPMAKLKAVYPNMLTMDRRAVARNNTNLLSANIKGGEKKSPSDLFKDFYEEITEKTFTLEKERVLEVVLKELWTTERGK